MARVPGPICTCSCCSPAYCAQMCMPSSFLPAGMPDFSDVPAPLRQWLSAADGATRNRPFSSYAPSLLPGNGGGCKWIPHLPRPPPSPRWLALHTCILCMHEHPHISSFIRSRVSLNGQRGGGGLQVDTTPPPPSPGWWSVSFVLVLSAMLYIRMPWIWVFA